MVARKEPRPPVSIYDLARKLRRDMRSALLAYSEHCGGESIAETALVIKAYSMKGGESGPHTKPH